MDDLGGKPIIFGNIHIYIYIYFFFFVYFQLGESLDSTDWEVAAANFIQFP